MARPSKYIAIFVTLVLAACSTAVAPDATSASQTPSATRGLAYAQQACASCHAVQAGQGVSLNRGAPAFTVIANTPGMTPTALNAWLHSAHASMPNLIVEPNDRADIAAYLETLRRANGAS